MATDGMDKEQGQRAIGEETPLPLPQDHDGRDPPHEKPISDGSRVKKRLKGKKIRSWTYDIWN